MKSASYCYLIKFLCCFGSLLYPERKYLFEFIIVKHKSGFFIDCGKDQSKELFKQLSIYKLYLIVAPYILLI